MSDNSPLQPKSKTQRFSIFNYVKTQQILTFEYMGERKHLDFLATLLFYSFERLLVLLLPLKKCRTDEPLSPPNKVFASSQVRPTNSSTATARMGPVKINRIHQLRENILKITTRPAVPM